LSITLRLVRLWWIEQKDHLWMATNEIFIQKG